MPVQRNCLFLSILLLTALVVGCKNKLETGYQPRALNSSQTVRRGYYASPFSPEAKAAQMERDQELEARRPRQGY
jgi:hypothetical protein